MVKFDFSFNFFSFRILLSAFSIAFNKSFWLNKLRATGWIKSTADEIEVMYASDEKALVRLNFSRINKDGEAIVTTNAIYTLTKINNKWGIAVLFVGANDLPLN